MDDVKAVGRRVEQLLGELRSGDDPRAAAIAEDLVGSLVQLYGAGLARVMDLVGADARAALADDPLVESLLLVHDLHPLDVDTRLQRALDRVRPYLGSHAGGVDYLGVDEHGVVRLRLEGSCNGCASSTETVRLAITQAVEEAAPETAGIAVEGVADPPPKLLQIGRRPGLAEPPANPGWVRLTEPAPPAGTTTVVTVADHPVLLCRLGSTVYAYRSVCPACRASLHDARLEPGSGALHCPGCAHRYDVRLAGAGIDDPARHLVPLPLLVDADGVRVAVPDTALAGAGT
jgi:Fe-S cluster biogenesis protein NfuA/nitrite reductase/ring-hydroxylating ferredoxin subunit